MTTKRFLITWAITTVAVFALNSLFHGLAAADFFEKNNAGIGNAAVKMDDFNPMPIFVLETILAFCVTWTLPKINLEHNGQQTAVIIGALFHLAAAASYNLVSSATLVSWPVVLTLVDVPWHVFVGAVAGWMAYKLGFRKP